MNKRNCIYVIGLLILIFIIPLTYGYSITPAKSERVIGEGKSYDFDFDILNNGKENLSLRLSAIGDLKDYIDFEKELIEINEQETRKKVSFTLNTLSNLGGGKKETLIFVENIKELRQSSVSAKTGLIYKITTISQTKGLALDFGEILISVDNNETLITLSYQNTGTEPINNLNLKVSLYDGQEEQKLLESIEKNKSKIEENEKGKVVIRWLPKYFGNFDAVFNINYDGVLQNFTKKINIGKHKINIEMCGAKFVSAIYKINCTVFNNWNSFAEGGELIFVAKTDEKEIERKTLPLSKFDKYERRVVESYFDSKEKLDFEVISGLGGERDYYKIALVDKIDLNKLYEKIAIIGIFIVLFEILQLLFIRKLNRE